MAKPSPRFVCQSCGAVHGKWSGRCGDCGAWNTIVEEASGDTAPAGLGSGKGRKLTFTALADDKAGPEPARRVTGIAEFDRVTGGGLVPGSAVLVGGDPGIGKSTLMLQVAAGLAGAGAAAYISGEESIDQIRLRAGRLGLLDSPVALATATNVRDIAGSIEAADGPRLVIIDSIQTMYVDTIESAPGTVAQVRASAQALIRVAKRKGAILLLVGHVTKEGTIAGPRVLEHMVDTVLYFEGERGHQFRILRAVKNRFGPTDEIGVFEMTDAGLIEVPNPSSLFLGRREAQGDAIPGSSVFAGMEGTRPILVEFQALIAPSSFATPRRAVVGWDAGRLHMVLAVLEARCGLALAGRDVYLNVAGGLRVNEPAADLAAAAAVVSSLVNQPAPERSVVFGEIGLSGEIRNVSQSEIRLKEAVKLGFTSAVVPPRAARDKRAGSASLVLKEVSALSDLVALFDEAGVAPLDPMPAPRRRPGNRPVDTGMGGQ
ncbi:MAG: DNA repair protein RadA [Alphaproteobacteria bacterium]